MDAETVSKLDECVNMLNSNRSDAIRKGIEMLNSKLKAQNVKK